MRQFKPTQPANLSGTTAGASPIRLTATALDAAAVAVSTALIIGMVGSLVFFLIIAFYRGQYDSRLMYIFGLYTAATVLVARIAIDSGRAYANAFSFPLAFVSILAILRFVTISGPLAPLSWLINIALLAITWFLSDRITFDCTMISERERSLQQGLLQSLGLLKSDSIFVRESELAKRPKPSRGDGDTEENKKRKKKRKHNPGIWVLYFALLAFPLFGLGELAIPDAGQRVWAFAFLVSYLACALSLLVLTSLVGMRRYLRQRGVAMPEEMSLQWLTLGIGGAVLILCVCWVLPLPGRSLGLVGLPSIFQSPDGLGTSSRGWGEEGSENQANADASRAQPESGDDGDAPADGPPRADGKGKPQASKNAGDNAPPQGQGDGKQTESKQGKTENNSGEKQSGDEGQARKPDVRDEGQARKPDVREGPENNRSEEKMSENSSNSNSSSSANNPVSQLLSQFGSLGELFKWLTIAVLAGIVLIYALTHPAEIARLWRELCVLLASLFGRRPKSAEQTAEEEVAKSESSRARRPFSSFANPFTSQMNHWTPTQVIEHSFAALEAWGAEHGAPRQNQQTAAEFARQLTNTLPSVGPHAATAANMLDQLMFADWKPQSEDLKPLVQLWKSLSH